MASTTITEVVAAVDYGAPFMLQGLGRLNSFPQAMR